jgi:hypothetical protein
LHVPHALRSTSGRATRPELFSALQSLSETIPEMRAGQVVAPIGELCADLHGRGMWDAADGELLEAAWQFHRNSEAAAITLLGTEFPESHSALVVVVSAWEG